ncbi:MAG: hypothetical protein JWM60_2809 [Solirubrobacterales bacterium]|nr:hypothetical protein [Solirubrobacterales bacterium]
MGLAIGTAAVVLVVLLWELSRPTAMRALSGVREAWRRRGTVSGVRYDPGRERRAEQRARELLRSCVSQLEWEMYRDLGLLRVHGPVRTTGATSIDAHTDPDRSPAQQRTSPADLAARVSEAPAGTGSGDAPPQYAYLIYPHKPIVAYVPATGELLSEYCVAFPDESRPYGSARLPDSDDVLAKWMALTGDERRLIGEANMHLPGRQVDPDRVRRDLARLERWQREREPRGRPAEAGDARGGNVAAA